MAFEPWARGSVRGSSRSHHAPPSSTARLLTTSSRWHWRKSNVFTHSFHQTSLAPPFSSIVLNGASRLYPADIVRFCHLVDQAGCRSISIMSPYDQHKRERPLVLSDMPSPQITLTNLVSLELDTRHFKPEEWTKLLRCFTIPKLTSLSVRGSTPPISLCRFLARHPTIEKLELYSRWGLPFPGFPQRVMRMPHLETLGGPPCHILPLFQSLSEVPKDLKLRFCPEIHTAYREYLGEILQVVRFGEANHANLDVSIHHTDRHFAPDSCFAFDYSTLDSSRFAYRRIQSLLLFLPALPESFVMVGLIVFLLSGCINHRPRRIFVHDG